MPEILSNEDNEYLLSLIKENKMVEAVLFVKEKTDMGLKQAKEYVDTKRINDNTEYTKNKNSNKKTSYKRGYIIDNKTNTLIRDLNRQRKLTKVIRYIILIAVIISLIQLYFLDKTSFIQMSFFGLCIAFIFFLSIAWLALTLSTSTLEKRMNKIEELRLELSSEFEIKSLRHEALSFYSIIFIVLIFTLSTHTNTLLKESKELTYKSVFEIMLLIGFIIYCVYNFFKELKNRKYSLSISGETVKIFYENKEINSIKIDEINYIEFYSITHRRKALNPSLRIFDNEKKMLVEMDIAREDYHILTMYFTNYDVLIQDKYNLI